MASLKVLTYNVHCQQDDRAALDAVVRSVAPDVVCVQEGPCGLRWRNRTADLAHRWDLMYGVGGAPAAGNAVLVNLRVRVLATRSLRFPIVWRHHIRGAAVARCSVGDATFVVCGTHLSTDPALRTRQAQWLRRALAAMPWDDPLIIGADINGTADGSAWRALAEGLVDTGAAMGHEHTPTMNTTYPHIRIDGILAAPALPVRSYEVVDSPGVRRASDHFPVVAELALSGLAAGAEDAE